MDPLPSALFRREMGWPLHARPFDYTKVLTSLHARPEDHVTLTLNSADPFADEMDPIYNMDFCSGSNSNVVAVGYESGFVALIDTNADVNERRRAVHGCHESAIFSLGWSLLNPHQLVTGSGDQNIRVWDCTDNIRLLREFRGHSRTVKKVAFHPSQSDTLASAGRDGAIRIWDLRSHNDHAENYITYAHSQLPNKRLKITIDTEVPVTDLLFQDDNTLISCGSHDGFIKFWDLRKTYKQLKKKEPFRTIRFPLKERACVGYASLCLDKMNNLYAASAAREIFKFNLSADEEKPCSVFENHERMDFDVKMSVSSCGRYLGSGSRSAFAHIWDTWNTSSTQPFMYLETEASVVSFSPEDPLRVITGGDDGRVVIWNADLDRLNRRKNTLDDKYKPAASSITRPNYLQVTDNVPLHPRYRKKEPERCAATAFDLSPLLTDLPNAVIDGNYSNTRLVARSTHTPKRRSSILAMIQSSPRSPTSNASSCNAKRSSPVSSKSTTTPKAKRRKSIRSESPSSVQPKIISFLQQCGQTVL